MGIHRQQGVDREAEPAGHVHGRLPGLQDVGDARGAEWRFDPLRGRRTDHAPFWVGLVRFGLLQEDLVFVDGLLTRRRGLCSAPSPPLGPRFGNKRTAPASRRHETHLTLFRGRRGKTHAPHAAQQRGRPRPERPGCAAVLTPILRPQAPPGSYVGRPETADASTGLFSLSTWTTRIWWRRASASSSCT